MPSRGLFVLVATFWVLMNVLLWRAEFGRGRETLSEVSLSTVVDRVLNAPDPSVLQIRHHGDPLGTLRWIPTVEEQGPGGTDSAGLIPEGMVDAAGYNLDLDLNLITGPEGPAQRSRVLAHVDLNTNYVWQNLSFRLFRRPSTWELSARAGDDAVRMRFEEGKDTWEQTFQLRDLNQLPAMLGPYAVLLPASAMGDLRQWTSATNANALRWSARNDWLRVGKSRIRTYRIEANLLGRFTLVAHLSRAGEILLVRLPDGLVLSNESIPFGVRE